MVPSSGPVFSGDMAGDGPDARQRPPKRKREPAATNPFEVLGVSVVASEEEVRAAFRREALPVRILPQLRAARFLCVLVLLAVVFGLSLLCAAFVARPFTALMGTVCVTL